MHSVCEIPHALLKALHSVKVNNVQKTDLEDHLDILAAYECWDPFFTLMQTKMERFGKTLEDFILVFKVQLNFLEDDKLAAVTCAQMVQDLSLDYSTLRTALLDDLDQEEEFGIEAEILHAILPLLKSKTDKIACLERQGHIYEKKRYDAELLTERYEELIQLDPSNIKALKYFKAVHNHHRDYRLVVEILERLYFASSHPADKSRIAMEWAATYLYQLNEPREALDIVKKISHGSHLDSTSLIFEANFMLQKWDDCQSILHELLESIESPKHKAVISFKLGEIQEHLGQPKDAKKSYLSGLAADPSLHELRENLIGVELKEGNWHGVLSALTEFEDVLSSRHLKMEINKLRRTIIEGLQDVG